MLVSAVGSPINMTQLLCLVHRVHCDMFRQLTAAMYVWLRLVAHTNCVCCVAYATGTLQPACSTVLLIYSLFAHSLVCLLNYKLVFLVYMSGLDLSHNCSTA